MFKYILQHIVSLEVGSLKRVVKIKVRSSGLALIQYDCCPSRRNMDIERVDHVKTQGEESHL